MNGDVAIAYEIVGDGSVDLLYLAPINNLEFVWENPYYASRARRCLRVRTRAIAWWAGRFRLAETVARTIMRA